MDCAKCSIEIKDSDSAIVCDGTCANKFHTKCLKLNAASVKIFNDIANMKFLCDSCLKDPLATLSDSVKKILSFMNIIDERLNRNDRNIENLNINIERCMSEKEKSVSSEKIEQNEASEIKTYANIVKTKSNDPVVLLKPKKHQKCSETKDDLSKNIDPTTIAISNIQNMPKGVVAIKCINDDELNKFKVEAKKALSDKYDVHIPEIRGQRVRISNIDQDYSDEKLIDSIMTQNDFIKNGSLKVISKFENKIRKGSYEAIVECDSENFVAIINNEKLSIGWNSCRVKEYVNVKRCFRCCGYNHVASKCKNKKACLNCGEDHVAKECTANKSVCVNCKIAVEKFKLNLDINHPAWSKECSVYKRKLESNRKRQVYTK